MSDSNQDFTKVKALITDIGVNIFTTKEKDGSLRGRPMRTAQVDEDGSLWFFTNEYANTVDELSENNEVYLTYASQASSTYVIVHGRASLSNDRSLMKAMWNPTMDVWFPEGLADPSILLIKVQPQKAEYWESASSKLVMWYVMAKAMVSGEKYDEGNHGKVIL